MFVLNDDNSIYATRGDIVFFSVTADDDGTPHVFKAGDVVRIKVYGKKDAESVVLQKDFAVADDASSVEIFLTGEDTKIGEVISKPKDYWYEVELNPDTEPQTIIGYDEDGAKLFKLFPEGADVEIPETDPEDIPVVDAELDATSHRPIENQAVARAFLDLEEGYENVRDAVASKHLSPEMFGAFGDGVVDDTEAVTSAIEECYETGATLRLLNGRTYLVGDIEITNPINIEFDGGALKRRPETKSNYYTLKVSSDNVTLNNPHLIGDRLEHEGTSGEWGHCLFLSGNNINVHNGTYEYAWGDGVYIYDGNNISMSGLHHTYKCSRNGVSIVKGDNITIDTVFAEYTDRTLPMKAVDIECNDSDDYTTNIHINSIISKANDGAFDLVCRGNVVDGITVDSISSIGSVSVPVNINYSEVGDSSEGNPNTGNTAKIGQILVDKAVGNAVRFARWNLAKCPYVSIDRVSVSEFTEGMATVDTGAIGLLVDRNYDFTNEFGGFGVCLNADAFDSGTLIACINNQSESYKANSHLKNIRVKSDIQWNAVPEISFPHTESVVFDYENCVNDSVNIMNGFNYLKSTTPVFRSWSSVFTIVCGVDYVDFAMHSSVSGKIYVNDEEYTGKRLFNMLNKVIYGYKDGEDIRLYFQQESVVWATTNPSSQTNPVDGQTIFSTEKCKPMWYYNGDWYYADGTKY